MLAIVEYLAQMIADGELSSESVTPESEHGAAGALMGAARDRVLAFTASSSQGPPARACRPRGAPRGPSATMRRS